MNAGRFFCLVRRRGSSGTDQEPWWEVSCQVSGQDEGHCKEAGSLCNGTSQLHLGGFVINHAFSFAIAHFFCEIYVKVT